MTRAAAAGAVYFLICFAAGAVLGPLREFVLVPYIGALGGVAAEVPLMLLVVWWAARFVTGRLAGQATAGKRAVVGGSGFVLLMLAEIAGALVIRQMSLGGWLSHFATPEGALSLALFLLFAAMPLLAGRPGSGHQASAG